MHPQTEQLANLCSDTADRAADAESFVAVKKLVELLGAELRAQPLLYEGMVAEPKAKDAKWVILVDSLSSGYASEKYERESKSNALPARVRFTIAHELSHVLQLRAPAVASSSRRRRKPLTEAAQEKRLELEADTLSPLLLIPDVGFARHFIEGKSRLDLARLVDAKQQWAVSREVLVNRFCLLTKYDPKGFRFKPALQDIAIGLGEWADPRTARISNWPRPFCNLPQNLVPEFLQLERTKDMLNPVFDSPDFILNGGPKNTAEADVFVGTPANPRTDKARIKITIEATKPVSGGKFLFVIDQLSFR